MEIVYTSLRRRSTADPAPPGETSEVVGILWAHARPEERLQHLTARSEADRVDLLVYLLGPRPDADTADQPPLAVAHDLLARSHRASPVLHRRYLPPTPAPSGC
ncbi:hypothetical protein ACFV4P_04160 [Kitasatospora sp. NPDC059795]|uniref:hypothetical protein n=1 Tax=Kitasatospora sp. NPDC059795 TaxID=3346949 RepID=UPI00364D084E